MTADEIKRFIALLIHFGGCFIEFEWDREGGGVGWALLRGWALINFLCL